MPGVIAMSPDETIASMLVDRRQDLVGIDIGACEKVFFARQSTDDVRRRSPASIAVSRGMVGNSAPCATPCGAWWTGAKSWPPNSRFMTPKRASTPSPRRGAVHIAGHDIFRVDPSAGATEVAIANASRDRPTYGPTCGPPDVPAFWPIGSQNHELMLMCTAMTFTDASHAKMADFVWGYSTVDLDAGATDIRDFAALEALIFSAVRNPHARNELYGICPQLSKQGVAKGEQVRRIDLPHTCCEGDIFSDGKEIHLGGVNDDIGVCSAETLERIGEMRIPSGGEVGGATLQITQMDRAVSIAEAAPRPPPDPGGGVDAVPPQLEAGVDRAGAGPGAICCSSSGRARAPNAWPARSTPRRPS